jgi:hypothetical protein
MHERQRLRRGWGHMSIRAASLSRSPSAGTEAAGRCSCRRMIPTFPGKTTRPSRSTGGQAPLRRRAPRSATTTPTRIGTRLPRCGTGRPGCFSDRHRIRSMPTVARPTFSTGFPACRLARVRPAASTGPSSRGLEPLRRLGRHELERPGNAGRRRYDAHGHAVGAGGRVRGQRGWHRGWCDDRSRGRLDLWHGARRAVGRGGLGDPAGGGCRRPLVCSTQRGGVPEPVSVRSCGILGRRPGGVAVDAGRGLESAGMVDRDDARSAGRGERSAERRVVHVRWGLHSGRNVQLRSADRQHVLDEQAARRR